MRRLAGGSFDYEDLGEQALKGIAQPTRAYRIVGVSEAASRFEAATQEGLTPLVGREQEIGLLLERWQLAQDGEGQVVLLSGEPGIGKSRILSALRERLEGARCAGAALPVLALLRQQRLLAQHRQLRAGAEVRPRRVARVQARQARSADRHPLRAAADRRALHRLDAVDSLRGALRGARHDAAEAQGRDAAHAGRSHRSGRAQATHA